MEYVYYGDLKASPDILNKIGLLRTEKDNNRSDWGFIQRQLKAGKEINIRPSTEKEKENIKRWALQPA